MNGQSNGHSNGHAASSLPVRTQRRIRPAKVVFLASPTKAMTEIGGRPLLWHQLMRASQQGFKEFTIGLSAGGERVKRYLLDLCSLSGNLSVDLETGRIERGLDVRYDWKIDLLDLGSEINGAAVKRLAEYVGAGSFILSRCDAFSDIDLKELMRFHLGHGRLATLVAIQPPARFGNLDLVGDEVVDFTEKPQEGEGWIPTGLFVLEPPVIDSLRDDDNQWESTIIDQLSRDGEIMAFKHESFWQGIEALRDRQNLESLWQSGKAPWKNWE
jgi:glucose-1-phosphate cytidylyltransferase